MFPSCIWAKPGKVVSRTICIRISYERSTQLHASKVSLVDFLFFSLLSSSWNDAFPSRISSASPTAKRLWISVRVWKRFRPLPRPRFLLFSRFSRIRSKLSTLAYTRTHRTVSFNCSNDEILASYVYRNWRSPVPKHKRHFETLANFACTRLE